MYFYYFLHNYIDLHFYKKALLQIVINVLTSYFNVWKMRKNIIVIGGNSATNPFYSTDPIYNVVMIIRP